METLCGGGGGYLREFCKGMLRSKLQTLTLLYTTFELKGTT